MRRLWVELRRSRRPGRWSCLAGLSAMKRGGVPARRRRLAGWTVAASYLFVQLAGLGGKLARPWLAWWLYASNSPDGWTVTLLAASAALPLVLVAAATFAIWRLRSAVQQGVPRAPVWRQHVGNGLREAKRRHQAIAVTILTMREFDIILGKSENGRFLKLGGSEHVALHARSGAGKTSSFTIPTCFTWPGSLVVLDVKQRGIQRNSRISQDLEGP